MNQSDVKTYKFQLKDSKPLKLGGA